ncbi:MAG TPA: PadR family transcriptional regulator [Acidimicrobiales bacterium]
MARNARSNPLALAVLVCLIEKDMHPYEITTTLRQRATDQAVRLNFGSLYGVVASLEKRGFIRAVETIREGKRPERTVYAITDAGREEMTDWLSELVAVPAQEYLQFEAALALIGALSPDNVAQLLRTRAAALEAEIEKSRAVERQALEEWGLPRLFLLEGEYMRVLQETELTWVRALIEEIESGTLDGIEGWRQWSDGGTNPWADMGGAVAQAAAVTDDPEVDAGRSRSRRRS